MARSLMHRYQTPPRGETTAAKPPVTYPRRRRRSPPVRESAHERQFWVFRGYKKRIRQGAAARTAAQLGTGAKGGGPGAEEQSGSGADVGAKQTQVQAGTGLSTRGGAVTA